MENKDKSLEEIAVTAVELLKPLDEYIKGQSIFYQVMLVSDHHNYNNLICITNVEPMNGQLWLAEKVFDNMKKKISGEGKIVCAETKTEDSFASKEEMETEKNRLSEEFKALMAESKEIKKIQRRLVEMRDGASPPDEPLKNGTIRLYECHFNINENGELVPVGPVGDSQEEWAVFGKAMKRYLEDPDKFKAEVAATFGTRH